MSSHGPTATTIRATTDVPAATSSVVHGRGKRAVVGGLGGLPRAFWFLWAGMLLNRVGGGVFTLLAIYLTGARGMRPELAGLVISLHAAGGVFAGPVGGVLADRLGRRATLLLGTFLAGTMMLALGFARDTASIVVLAPLLGFCTSLCSPPLQAAVADLVAPEERWRAYGLIYWAINLGFGVAASLGGLLAEHSFTLLFVIDAVTTFGYGALVWWRVPETRPLATPGLPSPSAARTIRALLAPFRDRALMTLMIIQLPVLLAFSQVLVALPLDMRAHGLSVDRVGVLLGLNGVVIVLVQPLALRLGRGARPVPLLAFGAALTGVGLGAIALASGVWGYAIATVIFTAGEIAGSLATPTLVAALAPADRRGAYQGTYQLVWAVASMVAPVAGSAVLAHAGSRALWLGCLGVGLCGAVLHLTVMRRRLMDGGAHRAAGVSE